MKKCGLILVSFTFGFLSLSCAPSSTSVQAQLGPGAPPPDKVPQKTTQEDIDQLTKVKWCQDQKKSAQKMAWYFNTDQTGERMKLDEKDQIAKLDKIKWGLEGKKLIVGLQGTTVALFEQEVSFKYDVGLGARTMNWSDIKKAGDHCTPAAPGTPSSCSSTAVSSILLVECN